MPTGTMRRGSAAIAAVMRSGARFFRRCGVVIPDRVEVSSESRRRAVPSPRRTTIASPARVASAPAGGAAIALVVGERGDRLALRRKLAPGARHTLPTGLCGRHRRNGVDRSPPAVVRPARGRARARHLLRARHHRSGGARSRCPILGRHVGGDHASQRRGDARRVDGARVRVAKQRDHGARRAVRSRGSVRVAGAPGPG